ncbi:hypothetical protein [Streptomyces parvulus]|uniref:hypothetical protein n=1 Tax=Streptomyces parvulus TaxID=146923 RepID=UPI0037F14FFF
MRTAQAHVRGIYATALQFLTDDQAPVRQHDLLRALDTAIHRRHAGAASRDRRALRHQALEGLGDWRSAATRADLAARLRESAREGLDLTEMPGQPHADVAAGIWFHGAYSSRRAHPDRPAHRGLSADGRPWLYLWTDDPEARNPLVLHAAFSDGPDAVRRASALVGAPPGRVRTIRPDAASGRPDAPVRTQFLEPAAPRKAGSAA